MSTFVDDVQHQPAATTKRETSTAAPTPSSTSPEANGSGNVGDLAPDGYPKDLDIPVRYVKGMGGDMDEARRRWIDTLKVRRRCPCFRCLCFRCPDENTQKPRPAFS